MRIGILGPFLVVDDQGRELALGGLRQRAVLAILVLHAGEVASSERLIDELWGEQAPATAAKTIQVYVSNLRKALGGRVLSTRGSGYMLETQSIELDADRFEILASEGRRALRAGDARTAAERLREALGCWRGEPLADFRYEPFAQSEIARLTETRLAGLEDRIDADLALGEHAGLIGELKALAREHPLRERSHGQLMLALYRCARQADALDVYQRMRAHLAEELGLEPGPGLKTLQTQILHQDPSLELVPGFNRLSANSAEASGLSVVVFTDLVGSTALLARLGDDRWQRVQAAHIADVVRVVREHGGVVRGTAGDGLKASFGSALAALAAASHVPRDLEALDAHEGGLGLAVRVGVSAGEPIFAGSDLHGMPVVIAARLCAAAGSNEVLVQDVVRALVASRNEFVFDMSAGFELKGVPDVVPASVLNCRSVSTVPVADRSPSSADLAAVGGVSPGLPLPRLLAAFVGEPIVGREREAAVLCESLLGPGLGCRAALLLGEPGIGKTRHAAALAEEAQTAGVLVVLARCPAESVTPFEPWVRALGELAGAGDATWRARLARAAGGDLCALVPELATAGPADGASFGAVEGVRYRVLRGIGDALAAALTGGQRLLLVLDDAHWCDQGSAQALTSLLDSPLAAQLSLLVTARDRELGRRHSLTRALNELRRTPQLTELKLEGLDANGVSALLAARLGRAVTPRVVARLLARTGGNPFFSAELAHDLEDRGALRDDGALDAAPVPGAIAGLVEERLERLSEETERFLVAVAAIGPRAPISVAGAVASLSGAALDAAVAEAVSERLVDEEPAVESRVAFPHALVREALLGLRTEADRARLHHAIAEQLAQRPATVSGELARHRELAAPITGPAPAIAAHRLAANAAARAGAHDRAADHLDAALRLAGPRHTGRAELLLGIGDQRLLGADLRRARVAYREAAAEARTAGDVLTLARAALGDAGGDIGFLLEMPQEDTVGPGLLREALDKLGDRDPVLALGLSLRRVYALGFSEEAIELAALARDAHRLAPVAGTEEATAIALIVDAAHHAFRTDAPLDAYRRLGDAVEQCLEHAGRCGRDDLLLRALGYAVAVAYQRADIPRLEERLARAEEIVARLDAPRYSWEPDFLRACRHFDRGEFGDAERLFRRAGGALRDVRGELQILLAGQVVLVEYFRTGDAARLHSVAAGMAAGTELGLWHAFRAWARALSGDENGARGELEQLLRNDFSLLRHLDSHLPIALVLSAHTAELCGARDAAAILRPALERLRGQIGTPFPCVYSGLPAEAGLGLLAVLTDDHDTALRELETTLAVLNTIENRIWAPWIDLYRALALHRRGGPNDRAAAEAALTTASEQTDRLGLGLGIEIARARAELDGQPIPPRGTGISQTRPVRALQARTGRRALAALVRNQDDAALEHRFANPRRQRALLRAMARTYQPDHARDLTGTIIVYTLEPYAIDPPPDAPWRWAIEFGERTAQLIEPAPLDANLSLRFGLADWVRIIAGIQTPTASMAAGRCRLEGDLLLATRLEAIFTG